jgi:hypothetical protein
VEPPPPQIEPLEPVRIDRRLPPPDQHQTVTPTPHQENKPPERIHVRLSGVAPAPRL